LFFVSAWASALGLAFPAALALPLWLVLLLGAPLAVAAGVASDRQAGRGGHALTLLVAGATLALVVLPIGVYLFADGFWPQLAGVVPLVVVVLGHGLLERALARLLLLGFGLVALRYTYGLNLGDLCLTVMVCATHAASRATRSRRSSPGCSCSAPVSSPARGSRAGRCAGSRW
jgi:hypothetical protein